MSWRKKLTCAQTHPLTVFMATPFTDEVRVLADKKDGFVSAAHRKYLRQLADDQHLERIWKGIEKKCGRRDRLWMRVFIREIAVCRSLADAADQWPDYRTHAINTERVIRFLKGSRRFPLPLPKFSNPKFIALLDEMASFSRQRESCIHISRETINDRREYIVCMQLLSLMMREFFNRWLDGEVADLTNIFFLTSFVTIDSVRAARRKMRPAIAA